MSFKVKTILLMLLISLLPYTLIMLLFGNSLRQEQLHNVTEEMNTQLEMTVDRIEQHFSSLRRDMAFVAKSEVMIDLFADDLDLRISRMLLEKKKGFSLGGNFFLVNNKGIITASSDFIQIGTAYKGSPAFSTDVLSPFDHSRVATLHVNYALKDLTAYFKDSELRHYHIITAENKKLSGPEKSQRHIISVTKALISMPNVKIVLEEDEAYAYRLMGKYELWFFITLAIGGVVIIFLALYFVNHLLRPLIELSKTANTITATQDYTTQVAIDRKDEIGKLGISFNKMIKGMQHAMDEITSLNSEIEETQREIIFTMAVIGERRSQETGNHVKRVAEYSKLLALRYGLSEKEAEMLKQASPMHDIGKVAIADIILNKPGLFTDDEFKLMQHHAQHGYEMLKSSNRPLLKMAAIVAHEHHEKWNGTGYPRGLKGEEIHVYGRITAIADVFDALGSDRVYKKRWEDDEILSYFKEQRGEHFDPCLVDIFFENLDRFFSIREKFQDDF